MEKKRIDVILVDRKFFSSREQAQRAIMAGEILVEDKRITKPGTKISSDANIRYTGKGIPYVSRGGLKLEKAIKSFTIDFTDKLVLDIGASTGGFTDCALKNKAKKVYAVDVGYGQLAWKLRNDHRVVVMERTNARNLKKEIFEELFDIAIMDVSFISVTKILPVLKDLIKPDGKVITLIKPQFEAGKEKVGKNGVVKDPTTHQEVLVNVINKASEIGFKPVGLDFSPIRGSEGNIEYLLHLQLQGEVKFNNEHIKKVVEDSHKCFNK